MNTKSTDIIFSTAPTKAEKLQELLELLNELFALKEKQERSDSASDPEKINYTTTGGENR
jgi:antitoxin component of MazEF toxin-antitoxin module